MASTDAAPNLLLVGSPKVRVGVISYGTTLRAPHPCPSPQGGGRQACATFVILGLDPRIHAGTEKRAPVARRNGARAI